MVLIHPCLLDGHDYISNRPMLSSLKSAILRLSKQYRNLFPFRLKTMSSFLREPCVKERSTKSKSNFFQERVQ